MLRINTARSGRRIKTMKLDVSANCVSHGRSATAATSRTLEEWSIPELIVNRAPAMYQDVFDLLRPVSQLYMTRQQCT